MTNKVDKPDDKPVYPVQGAMCWKAYDLSGGRCRARTYDPVIKSHRPSPENIAENFEPGSFIHSTDQWLTGVLQTAEAYFCCCFSRLFSSRSTASRMRSSLASPSFNAASIRSTVSSLRGRVSRSVQSFLRPMALFRTYVIDM